MKRPLIAVTIGDPAGIGPEIALRALADEEVVAACRPLAIGDFGVLQQAARLSRFWGEIQLVKDPEKGRYASGVVSLIDLGNVELPSLELGKVQAMAGRAAFQFLVRAIELATSGKVQAIATGPLNKESLRAAGLDFIGHTEILSALTGVADPLTMFQVRNLRVFFLTRHLPLRRACELVTRERVLSYIQRCLEALRQIGVAEGVLAVAGLNPHAGEHGLLGDEEMEQIGPAIREAQRLGYPVTGPLPADSVFYQALQGQYVAVLSLYHDQGHIATKMVDFERTVSVTLGLPFLRTSVDHGTAFDLAGTGRASPESLKQAILVAAGYARSMKQG